MWFVLYCVPSLSPSPLQVRTCCTGAKICRKCWSFMNMAVKVVDTSLRGQPQHIHRIILRHMDHKRLSKVVLQSRADPSVCACRGLRVQVHHLDLLGSSWYPLLGLR
jgi:hypothetical protein